MSVLWGAWAGEGGVQSNKPKHVLTEKNEQKHRFYCLETFQKMAPSNRNLTPTAAMSGGLILMIESNAPQRDRVPLGHPRRPSAWECLLEKNIFLAGNMVTVSSQRAHRLPPCSELPSTPRDTSHGSSTSRPPVGICFHC